MATITSLDLVCFFLQLNLLWSSRLNLMVWTYKIIKAYIGVHRVPTFGIQAWRRGVDFLIGLMTFLAFMRLSVVPSLIFQRSNLPSFALCV